MSGKGCVFRKGCSWDPLWRKQMGEEKNVYLCVTSCVFDVVPTCAGYVVLWSDSMKEASSLYGRRWWCWHCVCVVVAVCWVCWGNTTHTHCLGR